MIPAALGVLTASLIGSVHCAAMCGGFVCAYSGSGGPKVESRASAMRAHATYNLGRLISYLMLGALAGALGAGVSSMGELAGVANAATVLAGALMIGWAVSTIAAQRGVRIGAMHAPERWQRALGSVLYRVRQQPPSVRAGLMGLLTTMLPCGWLYVFVATAGGTGSVRGGLLVMALFWLGTVPALVAVGVGAQRLFGPLRKRLPTFSAITVLLMGALAMSGRLRIQHEAHASAAAPASAAAGLQSARPASEAMPHDH